MPFIRAVSSSNPAEQSLPAPLGDDTQIENPLKKSGGQSVPKSSPLSPMAAKVGQDDPVRQDNNALPAGSRPTAKPDRDLTNMANHLDTPGGSDPTEELGPDELIGQGLTEGRILFKKYVLKQKLGSGGMGEVWLVNHIELDCDRALKFIRTGLAQSNDLKRRFRREARVMARVSHPNAVEIHDAFTAGGLAFIEMSYVAGKSLVDVLKHGQPMALDWTARILEQLCEVLAVAHEAGIVHRDLKPANLMLLNDRAPGREFLKVLDFGIAKLLGMQEAEASLTNNAPIGTYPYMSPEQLGTAPVDQRSDIYTVGIILFEFLTGYRPYSAKNNLYQWVHQHVHQPVPTFHERNPEVELPKAVEDVVRRCLSKSPDDRPHSAQALFEEFAEAAEFIRPPSRIGSSVYSTPVAAPMTREPTSHSLKPVSGIELEPKPSVQPKETPGEIKSVLPEPEVLAVIESDEPSTLSGSFEWESPETFEIPEIPAPIDRPVNRTAHEPAIKAPVIADPAERLGPSGPRKWENVKHPRPPGLRKWLMAVGFLGILGVIGGFEVLPRLRNNGLIKANPPIVPSDPGKPPDLESLPANPEFTRAPKIFERNGSRYDLYGKVAYLPEGYKPKEGTKAAVDGWPAVVVREIDGVEFVRIAGAKYQMGKEIWNQTNPKEDERYWNLGDPDNERRHDVSIEGFYIQRYEVTNAEIRRYYNELKKTDRAEPELEDWHHYFSKLGKSQQNSPAVWLSWKAAEDYAHSVKGVLPTSEQWQFAASSRGLQEDYVWGSALLQPKEMDEICAGGVGVPEPVGQSPRDKTEQDVYDMGGNVREWCRDPGHAKCAARGGYFGGQFAKEINGQFEVGDCWIKKVWERHASPEVGMRVVLECPTGKVFPEP